MFRRTLLSLTASLLIAACWCASAHSSGEGEVLSLDVSGLGALTSVSVQYRFRGAEGRTVNVRMEASSDGGATWDQVSVLTLAGDRVLQGSADWQEGLLQWAAGADNPGLVVEQMHVRLLAEAEPLVHTSPYMVVDVSGGQYAPSYPVTYLEEVPADLLTNDDYKTKKIVLRRIPAGTYMRGSPPDELGRDAAAEDPQHQVTLTQPFYMAVFQTTQAQYQNVMGANPATLKGDMRPIESPAWTHVRGGTWPGDPPGTGQPQELSFVGRLREKTGGLTFDLPTEAEWEYACRAGTTTSLNSGKNITIEGDQECPHMNEVGRYSSNRFDGKGGFSAHTVVGMYAPNAWGLYDMHGNVYEWCLDWYGPYPTSAVTDPVGAASHVHDWRVVRGGVYLFWPARCRSAHRSGAGHHWMEVMYGFRVMKRGDEGVPLMVLSEPSEAFALDTNAKWMLSVLSPDGQGSTDPDAGDYVQNVGEGAQVEATPAGGWRFDRWILDGEDLGDENPVAVESGADGEARQLQAVFALDTPYVIVDVSAGPDATSYPVEVLPSAPADLLSNPAFKNTKIVLRRIPAGTFMMGSPEEELSRFGDETRHQRTLTKDFCLGVFQVTQAQYQNVMGAEPSLYVGAGRPVERVSWLDVRGGKWPGDPVGTGQPAAGTFVGRLRARTGLTFDLPTESQWEYACRAGTTTSLNSGVDHTSSDGECPNMNEVGRYGYNLGDGKGGFSEHTLVGQYLPNNWGLYDMHGNVGEWCLDWYAAYPETPPSDDVGPGTGVARVARGGRWSTVPRRCRSAYRGSSQPTTRSDIFGARLALSLEVDLWILSVLVPEGSGTTQPGTGTIAFAEGQGAQVTAFPAAGWALDHWLLDGEGAGDDNPLLVPGGAAGQTQNLQAVFAEIPTPQWTLAILPPAGDGSTAPEPGEYVLDAGQGAEVSATPAEGWQLCHWRLDEEYAGDANPFAVPAGADGEAKTLQAVFERQTWTLSVLEPVGEGATDPGEGEHVHEVGESAEVVATPAEGWKFGHWSVDGINAGGANPLTVLPAEAGETRTVQALFFDDFAPPAFSALSPAPGSIQAYRDGVIQLTVSDGGSGVALGSVRIHVNDVLVYDGSAETGDGVYEVDLWEADPLHGNPEVAGATRRVGSPAAYSFVFQPDPPLGYEETVDVAVEASDLAGNAMETALFSMVTEMRAFGANLRVAPSETAQGQPVATLSIRGENPEETFVLVLWAQADADGGHDMHVASLPHGAEAFEPPVRLTHDGLPKRRPALWQGPLGIGHSLFAAWEVFEGGRWRVHGASIAMDGSALQADWPMDEDGDGDQTNPIILEWMRFAWQDNRSGNWAIHVADFFDFGDPLRGVLEARPGEDLGAISPLWTYEHGTLLLWTNLAERAAYGGLDGGASPPDGWLWDPRPITADSDVGDPCGTLWPWPLGNGTDEEGMAFLWTVGTGDAKDIRWALSPRIGLPESPLAGASLLDSAPPVTGTAPSVRAQFADPGFRDGGWFPRRSVFVAWRDTRHALGGNGDADIFFAELGRGGGTNVLVNDGFGASPHTSSAVGIMADGRPFVVWLDDRHGVPAVVFAAQFGPKTWVMSWGDEVVLEPIQSTLVNRGAGADLSGGGAALAIPPDALPSDLKVYVHELAFSPARSPEAVGPAWGVGPGGLALAQPATLSLPVPNEQANGRTAGYSLMRYDLQTGQWNRDPEAAFLGAEADGERVIVSFQVAQFGAYQVALPTSIYDLDGDGVIGQGDYDIFFAAWRSRPGDPHWNPACDFTGDGFVGVADYAFFTAAWGKQADDPSIALPPGAGD